MNLLNRRSTCLPPKLMSHAMMDLGHIIIIAPTMGRSKLRASQSQQEGVVFLVRKYGQSLWMALFNNFEPIKINKLWPKRSTTAIGLIKFGVRCDECWLYFQWEYLMGRALDICIAHMLIPARNVVHARDTAFDISVDHKDRPLGRRLHVIGFNMGKCKCFRSNFLIYFQFVAFLYLNCAIVNFPM